MSQDSTKEAGQDPEEEDEMLSTDDEGSGKSSSPKRLAHAQDKSRDPDTRGPPGTQKKPDTELQCNKVKVYSVRVANWGDEVNRELYPSTKVLSVDTAPQPVRLARESATDEEFEQEWPSAGFTPIQTPLNPEREGTTLYPSGVCIPNSPVDRRVIANWAPDEWPGNDPAVRDACLPYSEHVKKKKRRVRSSSEGHHSRPETPDSPRLLVQDWLEERAAEARKTDDVTSRHGYVAKGPWDVQ